MWTTRLLRSLYKGLDAAAAPITLFLAIGMLLGAVNLPGAVGALSPIIDSITPTNPVLYVVVFAVLVPLCLYRGPLNIFGLGAGIAGAMTAAGVYSPMAVLGLMTSYNQVFGVADPTSTQTVWAASTRASPRSRSSCARFPTCGSSPWGASSSRRCCTYDPSRLVASRPLSDRERQGSARRAPGTAAECAAPHPPGDPRRRGVS